MGHDPNRRPSRPWPVLLALTLLATPLSAGCAGPGAALAAPAQGGPGGANPSGTPGAATPHGGTSASAPPGAPRAVGAEGGFEPLDLPDWLIIDPAAPRSSVPWILIIDDPQCPYCMQLHLAIEKAREAGDREVASAVVATIPFPLAFHDQAAHTVMDAFCLEAGGQAHGWSAAAYLDWLIVAPWRSEPGWKAATLDDIAKDGGLFDARYDAHKVTSSRRRDFQTEKARAESSCAAGACRGDADCEKLCETLRVCRGACPAAKGDGDASPKGAPGGASLPSVNEAAASSGPGAAPSAGPGSASAPGSGASLSEAPEREKCLTGCSDKFVSARYRQYSRIHSACLLEEGPASAHGKTAAAYAWAVSHKVPGTPTVYVGHPAIGFRLIGDSDDLAGFFVLLRAALASARSRLPSPG